MESIFCPDSRAHCTSWLGAGAGKGAKCPTCVVVQITAPGPAVPPACIYCEEKKGVFNITVCRPCSQMPPEAIAAATKGAPKPPLKAFRTMLNGIGEPFYEHICSAVDYHPAPPQAEAEAVEEAPQDDSQVQKLELLLEQRGKEVEQLSLENQHLREQLNRQTVKSVSPKPAAKPTAKAAPEVAPELPQLAALNSLLEKFDAQQAQTREVIHENGVLSEQVRALTEKLAAEESLRLQAEAALKTVEKRPVVETKHVAPVTVVTERIAEGSTAGLGLDIVCSLASVMPLLNELHVGDVRMNTRSMESFLAIIELGIRQPDRAIQVRKAMKTCVLIARLVGASKAVTSFCQTIRRNLEESPEKCLQLIHSLKSIYRTVAKEEGSSEVMTAILHRLEENYESFEGTMEIIGFLSTVLPPNQITELTQALFLFLEKPAGHTKEWLAALVAMPLEWTEQHKEKALLSIRSLMAATTKLSFDESCLQLLHLLNKHTSEDPEPLLAFISHASQALLTDPLPTKVLISNIYTFLVSPDSSPELSQQVLSALRKHFTNEASRESVALLMCVLIALERGTYEGLTWLFGDGNETCSVESVRKFLKLMLENGMELGKTAEISDLFFTALTAVQGLAAGDGLAFIKATSRLCEAKPTKVQIILETLTDLMNDPAVHPFINEIAQLEGLNEPKGQAIETRKLLNTVRKFHTETVLPAASNLTNTILHLRKAEINRPIFTRKLKLILLEKTNDMNQFLAAIQPLVKSDKAAAPLVLRLLEMLSELADAKVHLLSGVGGLVNALASESQIAIETAIQFCEDAVMPCFATANVPLLEILYAQVQAGKVAYLGDMIRASNRKFTTLDICDHSILPLIQPDSLRIFDCSRHESMTIPLDQPIKVDSSSSYAFVDNGGIVCCGGSDTTGAKNASASRASISVRLLFRTVTK